MKLHDTPDHEESEFIVHKSKEIPGEVAISEGRGKVEIREVNGKSVRFYSKYLNTHWHKTREEAFAELELLRNTQGD